MLPYLSVTPRPVETNGIWHHSNGVVRDIMETEWRELNSDLDEYSVCAALAEDDWRIAVNVDRQEEMNGAHVLFCSYWNTYGAKNRRALVVLWSDCFAELSPEQESLLQSLLDRYKDDLWVSDNWRK